MKKIAAIFIAAAMLFLLAGCSFSFYQREAESRNIYKNHIAVEADSSATYTERVAASRSAAVVSIISNTVIRTNRGSGSVTQVFSGVIIDAEGYVLTTSNAAYLQVSNGGSIYGNRVMSAYAVLPAVYNDTAHYKLTLIDYDTSVGLALFRFYDTFHYYTDDSRNASEEGFQIFAALSGESVVTGERCVGIGNSLGNALNTDVIAPDRIGEIEQTVMSGIISDADARADEKGLEPVVFGGKEYGYILTTVPLNIDMYGGALFDESGYLIGLLAMKIGYQSSSAGASGYFKRVGAASRAGLLTAYIDSVAEELSLPIPYTVASVSAGEAA